MHQTVPYVAGVPCHARPLPALRMPRALATVAALLLLALQVQGLLAEDRNTVQARAEAAAGCIGHTLARAGSPAPAAGRHCIAGATPYDRVHGRHATAG